MAVGDESSPYWLEYLNRRREEQERRCHENAVSCRNHPDLFFFHLSTTTHCVHIMCVHPFAYLTTPNFLCLYPYYPVALASLAKPNVLKYSVFEPVKILMTSLPCLLEAVIHKSLSGNKREEFSKGFHRSLRNSIVGPLAGPSEFASKHRFKF
jgi:hypothetical protein